MSAAPDAGPPAVSAPGWVARIGERVLEVCEDMGRFTRLSLRTFRVGLHRGFPWRACLEQFEAIAVRSMIIVCITALFTGMVLALQTVVSLSRFGAKPYTGSFVGLALCLELGPVLTALMVAGRVGAGITAELGSMKVTEQIDAIRAMGADPVQKLVLPRVLACTLGVPMLVVLADLLGVFGGMLISTQHGITPNFYLQTVYATVTLPDFLQGVSKTFVFGWIVAAVACFLGLSTRGGTVGVGQATTRAVVLASIAIFVSDFFLTQVLLWF